MRAATLALRAWGAALALTLAVSACRSTPAPEATPVTKTASAAASTVAAGPEGTATEAPAPGSTSAARPAAAVAPRAEESRATTVAPDLGPFVGARARERAVAVDRAARRDLSVDEGRGGHTLERHVGKTDDELRERLSRERQISAASTYTDLAAAEATVATALAEQSSRVKAWADKRGARPNLALDYHGPPSATIGRTIRRGQRRSDPCTDAVIVLRWDTRRDDYYVLTSYPERRR